MKPKNRSIFFIPVWFGDYFSFISALDSSEAWISDGKDTIELNYLLNYVSAIASDERLFKSYSLKEQNKPEVCMFKEKLNLNELPTIEAVRFSCFGTGVGFMEFCIVYPDSMTPLEIADFSYYFKKSTKAKIKQRSLFEVASGLLPKGSNAVLFFTNSADFKKECLCYHMICVEKDEYQDEMSDILYLLRRSYSRKFQSEYKTDNSEDGDYDMMYSVYSYDRWAGSQSGIVNMVSLTGNDDTDYFIKTYRMKNLMNDYRFLYLLLLNQRFSAIQYVAQIAQADYLNPGQLKKLNKNIIKLKTAYSFNVVSDDQFFQNVYSKMYKILDIDRLLEDIRDNEAQMEILQMQSTEKYEKSENKILFSLSFLTLFSALIDAADFFDRWPILQTVSKYVSLCCVLVIAVICGIWIFASRNK